MISKIEKKSFKGLEQRQKSKILLNSLRATLKKYQITPGHDDIHGF